MTSSTFERDVYRLPLHTPPQAARIVAVPPAALRNWVQGYSYKMLNGVVEALDLAMGQSLDVVWWRLLEAVGRKWSLAEARAWVAGRAADAGAPDPPHG
ncbi:MAG: hypothetical protein ACRDRP_03420 [Pseudonocardiaceae bacterium]